MIKQLLVLIVIVFLVSTVVAQQPFKKQLNQTTQISLEQQLVELNSEIVTDLTNNNKTTVAILDFVDLKGNVPDFGKFLAEELVTRLFKTQKLRVVDRREVQRIVAEQKASMTNVRGAIRTSNTIGILTDELIKKIGNQLGVKAIVFGTITEIGNNFRINARIISTDSAAVISTAAVTVAKDDDVCSLINCNAKLSDGITSISPIPEITTTRMPTSPSKPNSASARKEANFFTFDLERCQLSGSSVFCDLTVTNNDNDRNLTMSRITMFDNFGNESKNGKVQIANSSWSAFLVSGVPVKVRITFQNISPEASEITLLKLTIGSIRNRSYVEYRGIPLE